MRHAVYGTQHHQPLPFDDDLDRTIREEVLYAELGQQVAFELLDLTQETRMANRHMKMHVSGRARGNTDRSTSCSHFSSLNVIALC